MKQKTSITELARDMVGDGKRPNKYFVTIAYGWYLTRDYECDAKQLPNSLEAVTVLFNDKESAVDFYEHTFLRPYDKLTPHTISQVMLEDRLTGVIMEKILKEKSNGTYSIFHS